MTEQGTQKIVQALAEKAQHEAHEKRIEETTKLLSALYDRAAAYTNLIIVAGYAGFFAVWGSVKADLFKFEMLASALCLSFSLLVFVFWEVSVMLYASRALGNLNKVLQAPPQDFEKQLQKHNALEAKRAVSIRRIWYGILLLTIVPGLIGGAILMGGFIRQLIALV